MKKVIEKIYAVPSAAADGTVTEKKSEETAKSAKTETAETVNVDVASVSNPNAEVKPLKKIRAQVASVEKTSSEPTAETVIPAAEQNAKSECAENGAKYRDGTEKTGSANFFKKICAQAAMTFSHNSSAEKGNDAAPEGIVTEGSEVVAADNFGGTATEKPARKKRFRTLRAAAVCLGIFVVLCGIIYPLSVTLVSQTAFPYQANGSQIVVTIDGVERVFGSELIGQSYEDPKYLFGRVNTGAPSNLSPESEEFLKLLEERKEARKQKLAAIGYTDTGAIPAELLTAGGSGVDPHISPAAAYFQIPAIVAARNANAAEENKITDADVKAVIDKYTEGRFLGIFGEERVVVLLVNLALDGLL